jgi:hypothetical protein
LQTRILHRFPAVRHRDFGLNKMGSYGRTPCQDSNTKKGCCKVFQTGAKPPDHEYPIS